MALKVQSQQLAVASGFTSFREVPRNRRATLQRLVINNQSASGTVILHVRDVYTRQRPASASSVVNEDKFQYETSRTLEVVVSDDLDGDLRFIGIPQVRSEVSGAVVTLAFELD